MTKIPKPNLISLNMPFDDFLRQQGQQISKHQPHQRLCKTDAQTSRMIINFPKYIWYFP